MTDIQYGKISSTSPLRVLPDGSTTALYVSSVVGSTPSLNQRVLWFQVGNRTVVMAYTDTT